MRSTHTALLALHYQNDVVHEEGAIRLGTAREGDGRRKLVAAAQQLLTEARAAELPVIHVRIAFPRDYVGVVTNAPIFQNVVESRAMQEGTWGAEFYQGLEPLVGETVVTHRRVNAFYDSRLAVELDRMSVRRLVMAGVATNSTVEHSARHAADMGFEVVVVADACSASRTEVHEAALFNISLIGTVALVDKLFTEGVA